MIPLFLLTLILATCHTILGEAPEHSASLHIISRAEWGSSPLKTPALNLDENPPPYVVIHHSDTPPCQTQATCAAKVRSFQNYHINDRKWDDIGYNFVIGEDGNIYEGRGWGKRGAHSVSMNPKSIGICIIGKYNDRVPNTAAIDATQQLIAYGVTTGKIKQDYKLLGHRQTTATTCPGDSLYNLIKTWPNWSATV